VKICNQLVKKVK